MHPKQFQQRTKSCETPTCSHLRSDFKSFEVRISRPSPRLLGLLPVLEQTRIIGQEGKTAGHALERPGEICAMTDGRATVCSLSPQPLYSYHSLPQPTLESSPPTNPRSGASLHTSTELLCTSAKPSQTFTCTPVHTTSSDRHASTEKV